MIFRFSLNLLFPITESIVFLVRARVPGLAGVDLAAEHHVGLAALLLHVAELAHGVERGVARLRLEQLLLLQVLLDLLLLLVLARLDPVEVVAQLPEGLLGSHHAPKLVLPRQRALNVLSKLGRVAEALHHVAHAVVLLVVRPPGPPHRLPQLPAVLQQPQHRPDALARPGLPKHRLRPRRRRSSRSLALALALAIVLVPFRGLGLLARARRASASVHLHLVAGRRLLLGRGGPAGVPLCHGEVVAELARLGEDFPLVEA
mmetsp:Transcript_3411/g.8912  ORF Transcript_3411/g.8912 Transcript_3411/m.8912 type:complete len:260 (-) Transcript_3411:556-1335(-)